MKETIKAWLREFGRSREWLAEQCGVAKKTVDNWLSSSKVIPDAKQLLIVRLIESDKLENDKRKASENPASRFSLECTREEFVAYNKASASKGLTIEEWAIEELNDAAGVESKMNPSTETEGIGPLGVIGQPEREEDYGAA